MQLIKINWKAQWHQIEPYLGQSGGLVIVTGGSSSARSTFIKIIRGAFKQYNGESSCINLDAGAATSHTEVDIIVKMERALNLEAALGSNLTVASNLSSKKGNVTVAGVSVVETGVNPYQILHEKLQRGERIIAAIKERIRYHRVALILDNWQILTDITAKWFWREFWESDVLEGLINDGLLVICAYEVEGKHYSHKSLTPTPDCVIPLPAAYSDKERDDAITDISNYLASEYVISDEMALDRAKSILSAWQDEPSQVYAGLPNQRYHLEKR